MLNRLKGVLKLVNSRDHEAEVNLAAYGCGVLAAIGWLTWWFYTGPRDGNLVLAFSAFLTAVTGGLFKKGSNAPQEPPKGDQP